jgi:hypothetical protein
VAKRREYPATWRDDGSTWQLSRFSLLCTTNWYRVWCTLLSLLPSLLSPIACTYHYDIMRASPTARSASRSATRAWTPGTGCSILRIRSSGDILGGRRTRRLCLLSSCSTRSPKSGRRYSSNRSDMHNQPRLQVRASTERFPLSVLRVRDLSADLRG